MSETMIPVWLKSSQQIGPNRYECRWSRSPVDELEVEYDGYPLRSLLSLDERARKESVIAQCAREAMTPLQRNAIASHWSAALRDLVEKTAADDAARRPRVLVDLVDD